MSSEQDIKDRISRALDEKATEIDAASLSKLRQARASAIAHAERKPFWSNTWFLLPAGALATAASLALTLTLWLQAPQEQLPLPPGLTDLELLASGDELELIEELEFYRWLENEPSIGMSGDPT